jgi:hypothetical protein
MTGTASAIDEDGYLATGALNGVYDQNGHEIKIYCIDDVADGPINVALVSMNLKTDDFRVDFLEIDRLAYETAGQAGEPPAQRFTQHQIRKLI